MVESLTRIKSIMCAVAVIFMATACNIDAERSAYQSIAPQGWAYADTISLTLNPADSAQMADTPVDMAIAIRHGADYEYSNIWLEVSYPAIDTIHVDTIDIRLADEFGRWRGRGVGVGFQYVDTVLKGARMNFSAPISIRHIMRADTLAGIEQAGIIITKCK